MRNPRPSGRLFRFKWAIVAIAALILVVAGFGSAGVVSASQGNCLVLNPVNAFSCAIGTLKPGEKATITYTVVPNEALPGQCRDLVNTASVSGLEADKNVANNTASAVTKVNCPSPTPEKPDIKVVKKDNVDPVRVGNQVTWTIEISNVGNAPGYQVTLSDNVPWAFKVDSAEVTQGYCAVIVNNVSCMIGTILPGATVTATIKGTARDAGKFTNTVCVFDPPLGADPFTVCTSEDITVEPAITDLQISKTGTPGTVNPDGTITYTIEVVNLGPDPVSNVRVDDLLVGK